VPVGDVAATARALAAALDRPAAARAEIALRGRRLIEERAGHDRNMALAETLYRDLLRRP
jgi:hypothetical protein